MIFKICRDQQFWGLILRFFQTSLYIIYANIFIAPGFQPNKNLEKNLQIWK